MRRRGSGRRLAAETSLRSCCRSRRRRPDRSRSMDMSGRREEASISGGPGRQAKGRQAGPWG